jgi:hypothetical protein
MLKTETEKMANDVEIKIPCQRLSYFHGFDPQERRNDAGELTGYSYNTNVLIPKTDTALIALIKGAMGTAKKNTWGDDAPRFAPDQLCLRDGEPVDEDGVPRALYPGYEGMFYISANRPVKPDEYEAIKAGKKRRPVRIIGPRKNSETGRFDELNESDQYAPYSGCYSNTILRIYGYVGKGSQKSRINASFEAVQFVKDGERFGARPVDVDSSFDEVDAPVDDMGDAPAKAAAADDFSIG